MGVPRNETTLSSPCCPQVSWERWLIGLVIGLVWGHAFEYAYHRWMQHRRRSSFAKGHLEHHGTIGAPGEAEHVTLGRSPFHIALLFAGNGVFVIVVDLLLGLGFTPGIFVGWTVYLIAAEEIHWRIHRRDGCLRAWALRVLTI